MCEPANARPGAVERSSSWFDRFTTSVVSAALPTLRRGLGAVRLRTGLAAIPRSAAQRRLQRTTARHQMAGWRTAEGLADVSRRRLCRTRSSSRAIASMLFHRVADEEVVDALDAKTGAPKWRFALSARPTATTSASTKVRARCRSWSQGTRLHASAPKGSCTRSISPPARELWSVDTMRRFHVREGLLRRGRIAAGRGRPRHRQRRRTRRREGRRHRRLQGRHRRRCSGRRPITRPAIPRRSARCSAGKRAVVVLHAQRPGRPRPGDRRRSLPEIVGDRDRWRR